MANKNIGINLVGLEAVLDSLNTDESMERTKKVVKKYAAQVQERAEEKVPVITGFLKGSIQPPAIDRSGLMAVIRVTAEYAPYVEYGTFRRSPKPFLLPALIEVREAFLKELGIEVIKND